MQNIVIIVRESNFAYENPLKIGKLYMNRFVIDEDSNFEVSGFYHIKQSENLNRETGISSS